MVAQKVKVQCWGLVWSEKVGCCWVTIRSGWLLELLTELTKGSSFQISKAVAGRIHNRPSLNRQPGGVPYWGWRLFSNRFFCLHCLCKTHVKGRPRRFLVVLSSHPFLLLLWCCYNCYCLRWWYCRCCCYCQCCCYCCCFKINRPVLRWESWDSLFLLLLLLLF